MARNTQCVADQLWNNLIQLCRDLGYLPPDGSNARPDYKRLVFSEKHRLLTFEVNRDRFLNFPTGSSRSSGDLNHLKRYFNTIRLDVVDLGSNLYFNFWIGSIGQLLPPDPVYA